MNVGPATADDLIRLGYRAVEELRGADATTIYQRLCEIDGVRHDPCVHDVFASVIDQADGKPARRWWLYSQERLGNTLPGEPLPG